MSKSYEFLPRSFVTHENGNSIDLKVPEIIFNGNHIKLSGDIIAQLHYHFKDKIPPDYFHVKSGHFGFESSFSANVVLIDTDEISRLKVSILDGADTGKFKVQTDGRTVSILMGALLINNLNTIIEEVDGDQDIPAKCGKRGKCEFSYHVELAKSKNSETEWDID